ncbi:MAG: hypothetical protein PHS60_15575, partial [Zavarzinia sp.]|nr:hypothetical protein [Zavarzinia sp.]
MESGNFIIVVLVGLSLGACDSLSTLVARPVAPWPGGDHTSYDRMAQTTRCRDTLAAPDCRVAAVPVASPATAAPSATGTAPVDLVPAAASTGANR